MPKIAKSKCSHPRHARYFNRVTATTGLSAYACDLCNTEGLEAGGSPPVIEPGIYKLEAPVPNPYNKDGRSNDWQVRSEIPVGTYFVVARPRPVADDLTREWGVVIYRKNNRGNIDAYHGAHDEMCAKLVKVDGSDDDFLDYKALGDSYGADAHGLLLEAMKQGKLTRADIEALMQARHDAPEEE